MDEKTLNGFLRSALKRGEVPFELSDSLVDSFLERPFGEVPAGAVERVAARVDILMQDAAIERARREIPSQDMPFGRFIEAVRKKACLTRVQICTRLRIPEDRIQKLERGDLSPIAVPPHECAEILILFKVKVGSVAKMVVASKTVSDTKQTYRASARSHGGVRHDVRSEDVERALDAFAKKRQAKLLEGATVPADVAAYVVALEKEMEKRGRFDLLK
jgi:hypothetical protein